MQFVDQSVSQSVSEVVQVYQILTVLYQLFTGRCYSPRKKLKVNICAKLYTKVEDDEICKKERKSSGVRCLCRCGCL